MHIFPGDLFVIYRF